MDADQGSLGPIRLAVTGWRHYRDRDFVYRALGAVHRKRGIALLIHGACHLGGVDWLADDFAKEHGIRCQRYPVTRRLDGPWPYAGNRRNVRMLDDSKPQGLVAFYGGNGTAHCVREALARGIKVWDLRQTKREG